MEKMEQKNMKSDLNEKLAFYDFDFRNKPELNHVFIDRWQNIIDITAETADVSAALILVSKNESMQVLVSSEKEGDFYCIGNWKNRGIGMCSEAVMETGKMVEVENALSGSGGNGQNDAESNIISYLGFPLKWGDGKAFGTICILDDKRRIHTQLVKQFIRGTGNIFQQDLLILEKDAKIEKLENELKEASLKDGLTGLYNHKAVHEFLFIEMQKAARYGNGLTIAMVDIDRFKDVNDQFGHKMGDILLKEVAELMKSMLRDSDIIGRYGGDEFLVILTDTNKDDAYGIIERLRKSAEVFMEDGIDFTISAGIASVEEKCTADELVSRAEKALHTAKKRGMNIIIDY